MPVDNPPDAKAIADKGLAVPDETIHFDGSQSHDDRGIIEYSWDFGDGSSAKGVTATHAYSHTRIFFVTLTVEDSAGQTDKDTISIQITVIVPDDSPQLPSRGFFMGVLPTPARGQSFDEAYNQASRYSEFVPVWGRPTPFYNLAEDLSGSWGQTFVKQLIRGNGMFPIIHLSFIGSGMTLVTPPGMENATLSDPAWRSAYKQAAVDVVKTSHPKYISLGNEVNRWYEKYGKDGVNGFKNYVSLYEEIYDEIKKIAPETKVFCVFAREIVSENREADLEVLHLFNPSKMDLLVFTSYPYALGKTDPSKIPIDYYSRAAGYMPGKPFGFSEVAWASLSPLGGEKAQADFLVDITGRLTRNQGINLYLLGWAWLHDLNDNDAVGLIKFDGTEKLGYTVWKNLSGKIMMKRCCEVVHNAVVSPPCPAEHVTTDNMTTRVFTEWILATDPVISRIKFLPWI